LVLFAAWGISIVVSAIPTIILFARHSPMQRRIQPRLDFRAVRGLLPLSTKSYFFALISKAPWLLLPLIVAHVISFEAAAYYYTPFMVSYMLLTIIHAINVSLFAHGAASGDLDHRQFIRITQVVLAIVLPAVVILIVARDLILSFFGAAYVENGSTLVLLLALFAIPKTITELYTTAMRIRQAFRVVFAVTAFSSFSTLLIAPALMQAYGLAGVGVAYLSCYSLAALYCVFDLWFSPWTQFTRGAMDRHTGH
jgi:O-antigen/teichoic acid export membrane protein